MVNGVTQSVRQGYENPAVRRERPDNQNLTRLPIERNRSFIFMGGLQRSGTTWLEGLVASPLVSGLSLDNVDLQKYQGTQPWLLQNHTRAYFEMVANVGGVEGKFVQVCNSSSRRKSVEA